MPIFLPDPTNKLNTFKSNKRGALGRIQRTISHKHQNKHATQPKWHNTYEHHSSHSTEVLLTKEGVGEAVPHAPPVSYEPPSLRAGREAERSPQYAHQEVAYGNVNEKQVDGRPQHLIAAEEHEHQQVVRKSESADEAQAHSHDKVPCRSEGGPVWAAPQVFFPGSGRQSAFEPRAAAQAHVRHDHRSSVLRRWHTGRRRATNIVLTCLFFLNAKRI